MQTQFLTLTCRTIYCQRVNLHFHSSRLLFFIGLNRQIALHLCWCEEPFSISLFMEQTLSQQTHVAITCGLLYCQSVTGQNQTYLVCVCYTCVPEICAVYSTSDGASERERQNCFDYCFATFMEVRKAMSSQWETSSSVISPVGELCCLRAPHRDSVSLAILPCSYSSPTLSHYTQNCIESLHGVKHTAQLQSTWRQRSTCILPERINSKAECFDRCVVCR